MLFCNKNMLTVLRTFLYYINVSVKMAKKVETCSGDYEAMYLWSTLLVVLFDKITVHVKMYYTVNWLTFLMKAHCLLRGTNPIFTCTKYINFGFLKGTFWMVHTVGHETVGRLKFAMSTLWRHTGAAEVQLHPFSTPALDEGELSTSRPDSESVRTFQTVIWTLNRRPVCSLFTILTELSQLPVAWRSMTHWKESGSGFKTLSRHLRRGSEQYNDNISKDSRCLGRDSNQTLPKHKAPPLEPIPSIDNFIKFKYDLYNTFDSSNYIASNNRIVNNWKTFWRTQSWSYSERSYFNTRQ